MTNPDGTFRLYEYNSLGQTTKEINELGYETVSTYDGVGRLLSVRDAEGNTSSYTYAGALKISETDPLGRTTYYGYDAKNRQVAITNDMGGVVRFEYDNGTNRTAVIDPVGNRTQFVYDGVNRLVQQIDPLGHVSRFAYDAAGNRIEAVDRNGRKRTFEYDALNRRTKELWWEGESVVRSIDFTFNALGVMTGASDPASTLSFGFDALNRLERATQSGVPGIADFTLTYGYDSMTNVVSVADNWGAEVASAYDGRNRLIQRAWQGGGLPGASLRFNYDAAGSRTKVLRYADVSSTVLAGQSHYAFSPVGLIKSILHAGPTGVTQADYQYDRNPAQEITRRVLGIQTADYGYDLTGQLVSALYSSGQTNESYDYDANGNRIGGGYEVAKNNQIEAGGTFAYRYDAEGSLVVRTNVATSATAAYNYDHRNRLVTVVDKDAGGGVTQTVEFTYDALNRRIGKTVNGSTTRFLLNRENIWADADGPGTITARYLLGNRVDEMLARHRRADSILWYLTDNLGTVRDLVDSTGVVVKHLDYDSFGRILAETGLAPTGRFLFTGRERDAETGLYFLRSRYFSPELGRFTSLDPAGFSANDYNLYRYLYNEPLTMTDPSGKGLVEDLIGESLKAMLTRPAAIVIETGFLLLYLVFVWACYEDLPGMYPGMTSDEALYQCSLGVFVFFGWMFSLKGLINHFLEEETGRRFL
ncbi:MAG: RHS repeat-associated core domain-containing protein [Verrucomicrobiia bacterium]